MSRRTWAVAVVVTLLVLGTGGYAVARSRDAVPTYRTAVATRADVQRTLDLSGTVSAAGRRDLSFAAAGTVSAVKVAAGARVRAGQVLARLDPTAFDAAVTSAVATLAKARAQLASDEDAQATAVRTAATAGTAGTASASTGSSSAGSGSTHQASGSSGGGSTGSGNGGQPGTSTTSDPALQQALATLKKQQQAVTAAQSDASAALGGARSALAAQQQACQAATSPTSQPTDQPTSQPGAGVSAACTDALTAVQTAQQTVADKQDALQQALTELAKTLGSAVSTATKDASTASGSPAKPSTATSTAGHSGHPTTPATTSGTQSAQSGQSAQTGQSHQAASQTSGHAGTSSGGGATVTAARLALDQAGIDTAQAQLTEARIERDAATLRAPYAGRILQAAVARGEVASTSGTAFVLVGSGGTTVSTSVTTAQVPQVRRGQGVRVLPAGWTTPLTGTVAAIGLLPGSDGSFAVTIAVASTKAVAEGTTASVGITTGSTRNAVTVPTSAVTRTGSRASVEVLDQGVPTPTSVTLGVVGARRIAIASGLTAGSTVVLADLGASLPTTTSTQNGGFAARRAAGVGGGGFRGGTFRGAG